MGVPYTIVKGKARLGTVVGRKTSSVVSILYLCLGLEEQTF